MPKFTRTGFKPKASGLPKAQRRGGLTVFMDAEEFKWKFGVELDRVMGEKIKRGLAKAGVALMEDTVEALPTTPILTSALRGSGAVFVDGEKVGDSARHRTASAVDYQAATAEPTATATCADIVFNAPYAAKQHEKFPHKSEPTAGMKYMESKMVGGGLKYFGIVAEEVKL